MALQPWISLSIELDSDLKGPRWPPAHLTVTNQAGPWEGRLLAQVARCGLTCSRAPPCHSQHSLPPHAICRPPGHCACWQPWLCGWDSGQFIMEVGGCAVNEYSLCWHFRLAKPRSGMPGQGAVLGQFTAQLMLPCALTSPRKVGRDEGCPVPLFMLTPSTVSLQL